MSGKAVLNISKSTGFAEQFNDFSWAELSDSEAYNKQEMHLSLIKFDVTSSVAKRPILPYIALNAL